MALWPPSESKEVTPRDNRAPGLAEGSSPCSGGLLPTERLRAGTRLAPCSEHGSFPSEPAEEAAERRWARSGRSPRRDRPVLEPGQRGRSRGAAGGQGQPRAAGLSHLSILITHRVMMEAVQHMTSMAMKTLQKRRPKIHSPPIRSVTLTKGMTARATERSASASETMR